MVSSTMIPTSTATDIRFGVAACDLGALLVAWGELGISAIELGDDGDELAFGFQRRFPGAALIRHDSEVDTLLAQVARFVEDPTTPLDLPLDVRGTAFELRVWAALREIPAGQTASYGELARRIGAPQAIRAVARACASNRIAVAIPCHRVIAADGSLSGYRWGVERKKALLAREGAA